jgi:hypothetical protein
VVDKVQTLSAKPRLFLFMLGPLFGGKPTRGAADDFGFLLWNLGLSGLPYHSFPAVMYMSFFVLTPASAQLTYVFTHLLLFS